MPTLKLNPTKALQLFQLIRYGSLLLIGVLFAQLGLSTYHIGVYESLVFVASFLSFFWLSGITQGLLASYSEGENDRDLIGTTFFILLAVSALMATVFLLVLSPYSIMANNPDVLYFGGPFFLFILLSGPAFLAEYVLLLKERTKLLAIYACLSYPAQVALVIAPIAMGKGLEEAIYGLVYAAAFRFSVSLVLVLIYGSFKLNLDAVSTLLRVSWPLILASLLSGSAEYIDGLIVSRFFNEESFAVYRYGAKEFPLFILMAAAFSNARINKVANSKDIDATVHELKEGAIGMIKWFFPIAIVLTLISPLAFKHIFNEEFALSAYVFNAYLLTLTGRMMFPQTMLIGKGHTRIVMNIALMEIAVNVILSLILLHYFGLVGIAYATVVAYAFEKTVLCSFLKRRMDISPHRLIPFTELVGWSAVLLVVHVGVWWFM